MISCSRKVFGHLSVPEEETKAMLEAADANQDGLIQVHEFLSWLMEQKPQYVVEEGDKVFCIYYYIILLHSTIRYDISTWWRRSRTRSR